jgi:uncharacterized protein YkwD
MWNVNFYFLLSFDIDTFRAEQLNLHNQYRAKHGVPPMTLDTK